MLTSMESMEEQVSVSKESKLHFKPLKSIMTLKNCLSVRNGSDGLAIVEIAMG